MVAKALKRSKLMLTKQYIKDLIAAWPDEDGRSSNPEVFDAWVERERRYDGRIIQNALGAERILALTDKQKRLLENSYADLLSRKDITDVSDNEIIGRYGNITEHVSPSWIEPAVAAYKNGSNSTNKLTDPECLSFQDRFIISLIT